MDRINKTDKTDRIDMIDIKRELDMIGVDIRAAIDKSFDDTLFINGPRVKSFEDNVAKFLGVKHVIAVANGTDALHLALRAMGVEAGDEVITTAFTFFATVEACAYIGAIPVFVDIDPDTMNIDVSKIEAAITSKTRAILPVHIFGNPSDMSELMKVAKKHDLKVLEDCAQSIGTTVDGKMTGAIGDMGAFSFYPTKNLGAYGDAGMVSTNDDEFANICRVYAQHGSSVRYYHDLVGYNSRLDDIQAAILDVKLKHLDRYNAERRRVANMYINKLSDLVGYQKVQEGGYHTYHQFTIRVTNRDEVVKALNAANIASGVFYPVPCHLQKSVAYLGGKVGDLPITERCSEEVLSLPMNPYITDEEIDRVVKVIRNVAKSV